MLSSVSWDRYFMTMAYLVSMKSKDPSTRVGSVIVGPDHEIIATGYNGLPRGIADYEQRYLDKEYKYMAVNHAEENAILHCARVGVSAKGCKLYVPWLPCSRCTKIIIQSGISEVMYDLNFPGNEVGGQFTEWKRSIEISRELLLEANVQISEFNEPLVCIEGLYQGKKFVHNAKPSL